MLLQFLPFTLRIFHSLKTTTREKEHFLLLLRYQYRPYMRKVLSLPLNRNLSGPLSAKIQVEHCHTQIKEQPVLYKGLQIRREQLEDQIQGTNRHNLDPEEQLVPKTRKSVLYWSPNLGNSSVPSVQNAPTFRLSPGKSIGVHFTVFLLGESPTCLEVPLRRARLEVIRIPNGPKIPNFRRKIINASKPLTKFFRSLI